MANKSSKRRGGLGRGMDALFQPYEERQEDQEVVEEVALDDIRPNPYQPRKNFDQAGLKDLADSIRQSGVFQPVILRQSAIKGYELIAGERRVRASRIAGKETIPAIVRQLDEEAMIEIAVVENLQREDLSPLEEAEAYQMLMDKLSLTQSEVAERIGKSRPYIANYLRLLHLPEAIKTYLNEEKLSMGQARTLLGLKDKQALVPLAEKVIKEQLTVRQLEELVSKLNNQEQKTKPPIKKAKKSPYIQAVEQEIQDYLGTSANIHQKGEKGKIEIDFFSESDLTRILDLLNINL
ncbi:ParB/RepB/Spo0J family partition protein [Hutsoniella sourekii]|uniref:ParB/RepB/Spo0J family partition protein n=1 Tax=Hutsoniella sourekii TaxID=87650 RepID=UPI000481C61E|nr:ParB/RepB/Spo0J family partition protein [Hutsoniella sourekii]